MINEKEKAKELAKLLTAFSEAKQLECTLGGTNNWQLYDGDVSTILVDMCSGWKFRIKPETKRVPLTQQDLIDRELNGKTISLLWSETGTVYHISKYDKYHIIYDSESLMTYETLKQECTFLDNSPCYKEVECE